MIATTELKSPELTALPRIERRTEPSDWPSGGVIDLATQDLPHASSTLEWWYVNAHLETESGRDVSVFASFFRTAVARDESTGEYVYAHALTWAPLDHHRRRGSRRGRRGGGAGALHPAPFHHRP